MTTSGIHVFYQSVLGGEPVSLKVFIGGLPSQATKEDVTAAFGQFGKVKYYAN